MLVALPLALLLALAPGGQEPLSWHAIDAGVVEELETREVGSWARELARERPTDAESALRAFCVASRAGHDALCARLVDELAERAGSIPAHELSAAADFLIGRDLHATARRFLERVPAAEPGLGYALVRDWAREEDPAVVDAWLAARMEENPRYWLPIRLRESPGADPAELLAGLEARVRAEPASLEAVRRYLEAVRVAGMEEIDPGWLGEVCAPELPSEAFELGSELQQLADAAAATLLERALTLPFTEADAAFVARSWSVWPRNGPDELLRGAARHRLRDCYLRLGRAEDAQRMLEAQQERWPDGVPPQGAARSAGTIQRASGGRSVEDRIEAASAERADSYEYWLSRASYFAGRGEEGEAEAAFERALALAPVGRADAPSDQAVFARWLVLGRYADFLRDAKGAPAADEFLRGELEAADPAGELAEWIAGKLCELDPSGFPELDDALVWRVLAARAPWEWAEQRLLRRLAERTPPERRDELWRRCEALATQGSGRAGALGWVMTRHGADARAVPLLERAIEEAPEGRGRTSAGFTLFEARLALGDAGGALEAWELARRQLGPRELPEWLGRIALVAARAGDSERALEVWRRRANLDRADLRGLEQLAKAGLRAELRAFYRALARAEPECAVPARALALLGG